MRSLCPEIHRDKTHAGFRMHPCPGRNPQCGQKWNRANVWAKYAPWPRGSVAAAERLRFHPASAYNYSGEHEACKVTSCVMSSGVACQAVALCDGLETPLVV